MAPRHRSYEPQNVILVNPKKLALAEKPKRKVNVQRRKEAADIIDFGWINTRKGGITFSSEKFKNDLKYIQKEVIKKDIIKPLKDDVRRLLGFKQRKRSSTKRSR